MNCQQPSKTFGKISGWTTFKDFITRFQCTYAKYWRYCNFWFRVVPAPNQSGPSRFGLSFSLLLLLCLYVFFFYKYIVIYFRFCNIGVWREVTLRNQYFCKSDTEKQITTKKVTLMGIKTPGLQTIFKLCLEMVSCVCFWHIGLHL
jgi:hypothetical protein